MITDPFLFSGGWLLVSIFVMSSSTPPSQLPVKTSYRGISSKQMFLTTSAMKELRKKLLFTQLRFHCKKRGGRTFHIITAANSKGEAVVQYFSGQTDVKPASCGSFVAMKNDNSRLSGHCSQWHQGTWGLPGVPYQNRLFDHPTFVSGNYHWLLSRRWGRWECDDYHVGVSSGDFWKVFVR